MSDVHIKFLFDTATIKKRLKWKDIKMIRRIQREGRENFDIEKLQILACRFMADEAGNYLPFEQAFEIFEELTQEESEDALSKFTEVFTASSLPNVSGSQLNSISEAPSLTPTHTTSPTGSTS